MTSVFDVAIKELEICCGSLMCCRLKIGHPSSLGDLCWMVMM